ncbi:MAG: FAD-dependent oxidoreductase [Chitinophagaceae bacterium]
MIQHSIWELESFYAPKDVIIAGGGLAGLWSAYYLKLFAPRLKVLIIDKGVIPSGASTRNAGFACFGSVTELIEDARIMGENNMRELVAMRLAGLKRIKKVFTRKEIDFEGYSGYELIDSNQYAGHNPLMKHIDWLNNYLAPVTGRKEVFSLADSKIKKFGFRQTNHLVENRSEGQLHSGKLVQALLKKVQSMGVMVLTSVELQAFEENGSTWLLHTDKEVSLHTKKLLICSNAFASLLLPETAIIPARGQVLVTSSIPDLPFQGAFHYDKGFYYFRNLGDRILVGGARNKAFVEEQTLESGTSTIIQNELERFLREIVLPGRDFTITNRWSGIMGMAPGNFPCIEEVRKKCFCALGMGGMGVSLAAVVGENAARMMLEASDVKVSGEEEIK